MSQICPRLGYSRSALRCAVLRCKRVALRGAVEWNLSAPRVSPLYPSFHQTLSARPVWAHSLPRSTVQPHPLSACLWLLLPLLSSSASREPPTLLDRRDFLTYRLTYMTNLSDNRVVARAYAISGTNQSPTFPPLTVQIIIQ